MRIVSLDELDAVVQRCRRTQAFVRDVQKLCTTLRRDGRIIIEFENLTYYTDDFGETFHVTIESWNEWQAGNNR